MFWFVFFASIEYKNHLHCVGWTAYKGVEKQAVNGYTLVSVSRCDVKTWVVGSHDART